MQIPSPVEVLFNRVRKSRLQEVLMSADERNPFLRKVTCMGELNPALTLKVMRTGIHLDVYAETFLRCRLHAEVRKDRCPAEVLLQATLAQRGQRVENLRLETLLEIDGQGSKEILVARTLGYWGGETFAAEHRFRIQPVGVDRVLKCTSIRSLPQLEIKAVA